MTHAACVVGASIICVDVLVRLIASKKDFTIQDSGVFLACSLSLSFGVMVRLPLICPTMQHANGRIALLCLSWHVTIIEKLSQ